jgi:hypothetical protein
MKKLQTRPMLAAFFSSLVLLSSSSALALSIQFTAGNSGLTLQYDIPGMGTDSLTLGPGDPEQEFSLKGIAGQLVRLRIRVDSVVADSPVPVVNTVIRAFVTAMPAYEFALPLPFGDYGIETGLFKRKTFQDRNAPIEISLLCAVLRTDYDITFNLGQLFSKTWQGSKTLNDNVIRETIELEGEGLPT